MSEKWVILVRCEGHWLILRNSFASYAAALLHGLGLQERGYLGLFEVATREEAAALGAEQTY
jgi:hypothetical protein